MTSMEGTLRDPYSLNNPQGQPLHGIHHDPANAHAVPPETIYGHGMLPRNEFIGTGMHDPRPYFENQMDYPSAHISETPYHNIHRNGDDRHTHERSGHMHRMEGSGGMSEVVGGRSTLDNGNHNLKKSQIHTSKETAPSGFFQSLGRFFGLGGSSNNTSADIENEKEITHGDSTHHDPKEHATGHKPGTRYHGNTNHYHVIPGKESERDFQKSFNAMSDKQIQKSKPTASPVVDSRKITTSVFPFEVHNATDQNVLYMVKTMRRIFESIENSLEANMEASLQREQRPVRQVVGGTNDEENVELPDVDATLAEIERLSGKQESDRTNGHRDDGVLLRGEVAEDVANKHETKVDETGQESKGEGFPNDKMNNLARQAEDNDKFGGSIENTKVFGSDAEDFPKGAPSYQVRMRARERVRDKTEDADTPYAQ